MAAHGREVGRIYGVVGTPLLLAGDKTHPDKQAFAKEYLDDAGWFLFPK